MGKQHLYLFLICLLKLFYLSRALNSSSCPIDFNYVNTLPWDVTDCTTATPPSTENCCSVLRTLFAVGLSRNLNTTKTFYLPNTRTSISCFSDFQAHLALISVRQPITICLTSDNEFVANPSNCGGIMRLSDWVDKAGPTPTLDSSCDGDLAGLRNCSSCVEAALTIDSQLVSSSPNSTKCFTFIALYAAGIINSFGPEDIRTSICILGASFANPISRSNSRSKKTIIFAISGGLIGIVLVFGLFFVYIIWNHKRKEAQLHKDYVRKVKARVLPIKGAKWFGIAVLDVATNMFSEQNFIGQGTFGAVYKGTLSDGTIVAVKKMIRFDIDADQDFINEVEIISKIKHRNLLLLRGFSVTSDPIKGNERYLVYDFMPNGNLHDHIFNETKRLSWPQRKSIILDVAKGLSYCHNGIKPAIFHCDIKPTNILLDSNMRAVIADFGLAKQSKDGQTHMTTRVAGTYGYVAPEYALYGQLTEKSDVYSFGIIVLEIMSGRKVLEEVKGENSRMVLIADWAWEMVKSDRIEEVFDSLMIVGALSNGVMMNRFIRVGLLCAHAIVSLRPTILEALKMLEGDIDIPCLLDRPPPLGHESSRSTFKLSNSLQPSSQGSIATSSFNT